MNYKALRIVFLLLLGPLTAASCSQYDYNRLLLPTEEMSRPVYPQATSAIAAGDAVNIRFLYHGEMNTRVLVSPDGTIFLPLMGSVMVDGRTTQELHDSLLRFYSRELKNPDITISVEKPDALVYVAGEVRSGGAMPFRPNITVVQALANAVPDQVNGDIHRVILVRRDDARKVYNSYLVDADFATGDGRNIYMYPGDAIVVPRRGIAMAGDAVRQYLVDLLPFTMNMSYGFVHEVHTEAESPNYGF